MIEPAGDFPEKSQNKKPVLSGHAAYGGARGFTRLIVPEDENGGRSPQFGIPRRKISAGAG